MSDPRKPSDSYSIPEVARRLTMTVNEVRLLILNEMIEVSNPRTAAHSAYTRISRDSLICFCISVGMSTKRAM